MNNHSFSLSTVIFSLFLLTLTACDGDNLKPELASSDLLSTGSSIDVSGTGSTDNTISVEANCTWTVTSDVSWIHITSPSAGQGSGSQDVKFDVDASSLPTSQKGRLTIKTSDGVSRTITINQRAGDIRLLTNQESLYYTYNGNAQTLDVTCNTEWSASSSVSWLTIDGEREVTAEGNKSLTIAVQTNNDPDGRNGVITLKDVDNSKIITVTVNQGGKTPILTVTSPNNVSALGGTSSFSVSSNFTWTASIVERNPAGLTPWARFQNGQDIFNGQASNDAQQMEITVDANTTEDVRTIKIKVETTSELGNNKTEERTITQEAGTRPTLTVPEKVEVTHNSATFSFTATSTTFDITDCGITYSTVEGNAKTGTRIQANAAGGDVTITMSNLEKSTTYYFCAYATNAVGTTTSDVISFTTGSTPGREGNETPDEP
ncbi:MAG: BACON domain-containing protein [Bacteroidaceae bacterium]|nr:BACON domain-containing protein [Bacteroidaceae bacterium]